MSDIIAKVSDGISFSTSRKNGDYSVVTENVEVAFSPEDISAVGISEVVVSENFPDSRIKQEQSFSSFGFDTLVNTKDSSSSCFDEIDINDNGKSEIPRFYIVEPVSTGEYCVNIPIKFYARLLNPDKFSEEDFVWMSSVDGKIGEGARFEKKNLSPGRHLIFSMISGSSAISSVVINVKYDGIKVAGGIGVI